MPSNAYDMIRQKALDRAFRRRQRLERGAVIGPRGKKRKNRWDAVDKSPEANPDWKEKRRGRRA